MQFRTSLYQHVAGFRQVNVGGGINWIYVKVGTNPIELWTGYNGQEYRCFVGWTSLHHKHGHRSRSATSRLDITTKRGHEVDEDQGREVDEDQGNEFPRMEIDAEVRRHW